MLIQLLLEDYTVHAFKDLYTDGNGISTGSGYYVDAEGKGEGGRKRRRCRGGLYL